MNARIRTSYARHIQPVRRDQVKVANWLGVVMAASFDVVLFINLVW
jgi:hypothetical protein